MNNDEKFIKKGSLLVKSLVRFFSPRSGTNGTRDQSLKKVLTQVKHKCGLKKSTSGRRFIRRHKYKARFQRKTFEIKGLLKEKELNHYELMIENLIDKTHHLMETKKRYKDPSINLEDLACELGTNRTYMSRVINQKHNKRFNGFVNSYRYKELKCLVDEFPHLNREELASRSGFNSVTTMVRVIKQYSGLSYKEWKLMVYEQGADTQFENELQEH